MRQWAIPARVLCDKHLRGEHVEHHMIVGSMLRGKSLDGFFREGLIAPTTLGSRHDAIAAEMRRRGGRHESPLPGLPPETERRYQARMALVGKWPDPAEHRRDLAARCQACRAALENL